MSTVQSVERAFAVLRSLAAGSAGVSDVADRTGLPKSTVSRLLGTLVDLGAVEQSGALGEYSLGELILDLSASARPGSNLVQIARPSLEELVEGTGETAGLSILHGVEVYYLDQVEGPHPVNVRDWTGETVDAHVVSSGLVLMAGASEAVRQRMLSAPLTRFTDNTTIDPVRLESRLDEVRCAGVAWSYEELSDGLNSVAAPVFNPAGTVIAAVHVHGPSYRFPATGSVRHARFGSRRSWRTHLRTPVGPASPVPGDGLTAAPISGSPGARGGRSGTGTPASRSA